MENNMELNNNISVEIAPDKMNATVYLKSVFEGHEYSVEEVMDALREAGVKTGIDEEKVQEIVANKIYDQKQVVAIGKPCENGEDGYYTFYFDTDYLNNQKPKIREDGSVDYFSAKLFEKVSAGDKIAEYHPPTKGNFGFDITGKLLMPKPGKVQPKLRGKGFTASDDGLEFTADFDGKIEYRNYDLNISNIYDVKGDVDRNVGNIDFNGDVNISGNVRGGVEINATGNIFIGGHVEDAIIISGGDIIFQDGVNAKYNGKIEAQGNISGRFFENSNVFAKGDIKCSYMLNTTALCYGKIIVEGGKGSIIGGEITGVMGVDTDMCGNESSTKTVIRVGSTKEIRKEYAECIMKLKDLDTDIDVFDEAMSKMNILKTADPAKYDHEMYTRVFQSKIVKKAEKTKYEERSKYLFELIKAAEHSVVKVKNNIYPGSRVIMDDKSYIPSVVFNHIAVKKTATAIVLREYDDYM